MIGFYNSLILSSAILIATAVNAQSNKTLSAPPAQTSPSYLSDVVPLTGNVKAYPGSNATIPTGALPSLTFNATGYPTTWKTPPVDSPEVKAAINSIDWGLVPNATVRKADSNGDLSMSGYDSNSDPDCWWSASGCVQSKNPIIPPDYYRCPNVGEWGLVSSLICWCIFVLIIISNRHMMMDLLLLMLVVGQNLICTTF